MRKGYFLNEKAIVEFINTEDHSRKELEIPLNITANDLIIALNDTFHLNMDVDNIFNCHLTAENPIAFLHGNKELEKYGIRNGTRIIFKRG